MSNVVEIMYDKLVSKVNSIDTNRFVSKTWQENIMRCNNRNDLLKLSFTLQISVFSEAYI